MNQQTLTKPTKTITMKCGCSFETIDGRPVFYPEEVPDCERTWDLFCEGRTKGVFQVESNLGRHWLKLIKPRNISELSDVIALVRPGTLEAMLDEKNMIQHYADRKSGKDPVPNYHPVFDEIVKKTYGVIVYQEQAIAISEKLAGFSKSEADTLRKNIGKKLPEEMAKSKKLFIEKAKTFGVINEEQAQEIFSWIEKSARYSFNKSHSISYAIDSYMNGYAKAHFPRALLCARLGRAKEKVKPPLEVRELVADTKKFNIKVNGPNFFKCKANFYVSGPDIFFGLGNVRKVGWSVVYKIKKQIIKTQEAIRKPVADWNWNDFLFHFSDLAKAKEAIENLISAGALDTTGLSRNRMLFEFSKWIALTERERNIIRDAFPTTYELPLEARIQFLIEQEVKPKITDARRKILNDLVKSLNNPPQSLDDSIAWIVDSEERLLNAALTHSRLDGKDISSANCTCEDYISGMDGNMTMAVQINRIKVNQIKNGKNTGKEMAFLSVSDDTGEIDDVTVFSDVFGECDNLLVEERTVLISGYRDSKSGRNSFIVKNIWPI